MQRPHPIYRGPVYNNKKKMSKGKFTFFLSSSLAISLFLPLDSELSWNLLKQLSSL